MFGTARIQIPALLLLALVTWTGCQNRSASKLAGRWDMLPPEKINDASGDKKDDPKNRAADNTEDLFDSMAGGESVGTMSLVFHSNGKLETFEKWEHGKVERV